MKYLTNTTLIILGFYIGCKMIETIEETIYKIEERKEK